MVHDCGPHLMHPFAYLHVAVTIMIDHAMMIVTTIVDVMTIVVRIATTIVVNLVTRAARIYSVW